MRASQVFTRDLDVVIPWARLVFGNDPVKSRDDHGTRVGFDGDRALFSLAPDAGRHAGALRDRHTRTHHSSRALGDRQRRTERAP